MNRQEDHGCAIGMRRKTSGMPHGQPLHKMQHKSVSNLVVDRSLLVGRATSNTAARPSTQPECFSYLFSAPNALKIQLDKLSFPAVCSAASVILLLSQQAIAADWKLTPSLDLEETYSDNIRLAPRGGEKSDWVTQVNPGVSLTGTGPHLKAHVTYRMQNIFYANDSSQRKTNHQLSAGATAELVNDFLFLDGNASISQQNISLFGPQAADNTNITGNRASVTTYSISPYLRHRFGEIASSELRYTHDEVRTRVGGLSNSKGDSILFRLNSGPAFSRLGWGLHYNKQITGYSNNPTADTETLSGDLRFSITSQFSLTATAGYEKYNYISTTGTKPEDRFRTAGFSWTPSTKISIQASKGIYETNNYLSTGTKPEERFWTARFSWTPTARTSIEASTGHKFFGKTHSLAASHRSHNTVWSLNYSEDITTTHSQFLIPATINTANFLDQLWTPSIPDPVLRQQFIDSFIQNNGLPTSLANSVNYLTNRIFLQKQLQASVALNSAKSTLILSAFDTLREAQTAQTMDSLLFGTSNLVLNDNTKQIGGNALWNWRFSPRTNINASTGYTKSRSISTGLTNNTRMMRLGMTSQFRPKLNGSVNLRRTLQHSNQIGGGYQENAITASLLMQF